MAEMQKTLITKEGLEKMQKELEDLRTTKRAEVAQRLKEAIAMGDLSENSEYDEAKNARHSGRPYRSVGTTDPYRSDHRQRQKEPH